MGREATCNLRVGSTEGICTLQLEADALIWRGAHKGRVARGDISAFQAAGGALIVTFAADILQADMGAVQAQRWAEALAKPAPTLADKLGIAPHGVMCLNPPQDATLVAALAGHIRQSAPVLLAEIDTAAQLDRALAALAARNGAVIWVAVQKGKSAAVTDGEVRAAFRSAGFIDTKTCAISPLRSATRYGWRKKV